MIVTITYKLVLVVLGTLVVIIRPAQIMHYLEPVLGWCYLGLLLNVFCVAFMMFLVFHPTLAANMMDVIIRGLGKIHLMKRTEHYREKMANAMKQYQDVAGYFRTHKLVVTNVFCNISDLPFLRNRWNWYGNHCCITGNDFRCGGYASVTGRNGNQ